MAKTLIGNIKGKDGRGISKIEKTATTGVVDTYTITYTDGGTSTYEVRNADNIALQRQIVPSAAVESSTTASQAYTAGDYVVVGGVLRKVTSSIAKGSAIGDSNSTATTVTEELSPVAVTGSATETNGSGAVLKNCTWTKRGNVVYIDVTIRATATISAGKNCSVGLSGMPSGMKSARSVGWSGTSMIALNIDEENCYCRVLVSGIGSGTEFGGFFTAYCD